MDHSLRIQATVVEKAQWQRPGVTAQDTQRDVCSAHFPLLVRLNPSPWSGITHSHPGTN